MTSPPPAPRADSTPPFGATEDQLFRTLLAVAAARVVVTTVALLVLVVLARVNPPRAIREIGSWQYVLIGVAYGSSLVYLAFLRRRLFMRALAWGQSVLDALIVSVLVFMTGGVESVFTFAYTFPIFGASTTLLRRGAVLAWVSALVMFGLVLVAQLTRASTLLPIVDSSSALFSYLTHTLGMAMVGLLSSTLSDKLRVTGDQLAQTESEFEELQALHAAILRSLPAGLMTIDSSGGVRYANEAALTILRSGLAKVVGRPLNEIVPTIGSYWQAHREDPHDRGRFEVAHRCPDGCRIRLGFSFAPLTMSPEGSSSMVVFQDLTDIVRLKEAVERAERLATVGKFAAGLAHEVRNPLASMCASIDVLKESLQPAEPMQRLMSNVVREADRLNTLITDFLAFARPRPLRAEPTDLGSLLKSIMNVFANDKLLANVEIEWRVTPHVKALVDGDLIRQVVWNLVRNAAEASPNGRLILTCRIEADKPVVRIRDDGPGIPSEQLAKIFDPFYTTKDGGSGLGLAIAHSIIEAHGGELNVDSEMGRGTEVSLHLPGVQTGARPSPPVLATAEE